MVGACTTQDDGSDSADSMAVESSGEDSGANGPCVPGQAVACTCADGAMGSQVCQSDGTGFDPCVCDDSTTGGSTTGVSTTTAGSGDSDPSGGSTGDTGIVGTPSFEDDIKPILVNSCGSELAACHGREAYGADVDFDCRGWVSLEDAPLGSEFYAGDNAGEPTGCPDMPLYERLINLNSWQCGPGTPGPGLPVVLPGDPGGSYMMMKIDGVNVCDLADGPSEPMPPPGQGITLSSQDRAVLEAWILDGAPNN